VQSLQSNQGKKLIRPLSSTLLLTFTTTFIPERSKSVMPPNFAVIFEVSAAEIEPSLHDRHEKLLLLLQMNFPMAGMSMDNHCERWNETSPSSFEEEWLGGDFFFAIDRGKKKREGKKKSNGGYNNTELKKKKKKKKKKKRRENES